MQWLREPMRTQSQGKECIERVQETQAEAQLYLSAPSEAGQIGQPPRAALSSPIKREAPSSSNNLRHMGN